MSVIPTSFTKNAITDKVTISSLLYQNNNDQLNLNPSYQRNSQIWTDVAKVQLIQSIFGGIKLPPIIFSLDLNDDNNVKIVIDGKQRLSTIFSFINNEFKFYNEDNPENACLYRDLDEKFRNELLNVNLNTVQYINLTEEKQRDIFERINHGISLSVGEKLKGMNTQWIKDISDIVNIIKKPLGDLGIKTNKRCKVYECAVAIIALLKRDYDYVSKGKSCLNYIKTNESIFEKEQFETYKLKIGNILKIIAKIYNECVAYCKQRKYKKCKIKWTDLLIYIHMINENNNSKKTIKRVFKYLIHLDNINKQTFIDQTSESTNYNDLFGKRSNTNVRNFIEDRVIQINKLYQSLNPKLSKKKNIDLRNKVYAKCGTIGKSQCKVCNNHEIAPTNFQLGHIISKHNGGTYQLSNLVPICAACNGSGGMGTIDMDIFIKSTLQKSLADLFNE